jgi:hypothetical protein
MQFLPKGALMSVELLNSYQIARPTLIQRTWRAACIWSLWFVFMIMSFVIFTVIAIALGAIITLGFCSYAIRSAVRPLRG